MNRYPKELKDFVIQRLDKCNQDIAAEASEYFGIEITGKNLCQYLKNHDIKRQNPVHKQYEYKVFTEEAVEYVKNNYIGCGPLEMSERLKKLFGLEVKRSTVKSLYRRLGLDSGLTGRFPPGHVPWSKGKKGWWKSSTCFRKGNKPPNYKPVGTVVLNTDGYIEVKTAEPNVWEHLHKLNYRTAYGEIPDGMIVCFKDGNKQNCAPENLFLMTMQEHLAMNRRGLRFENPELTEAGLNLVKLEIAAFERMKRNEQSNTCGKTNKGS